MSRTIRRNGRELRLSPKEFDLLALLMLNVGRIFTREHLLAAVWAADNVDLRTVDVTIGRLRKAINRDFYPDPIRSVRGRGYKFREEFEEMHSRWVARGHKKRRLRCD